MKKLLLTAEELNNNALVELFLGHLSQLEFEEQK